jgi:hypothetical protein
MQRNQEFPARLAEQKPNDFLDKYVSEREARERAEMHVLDFRRIAENWCARAGEQHRDAERNRRAFMLATIIAGITAALAWVGWVR